jgi:hypothetical protein
VWAGADAEPARPWPALAGVRDGHPTNPRRVVWARRLQAPVIE